MTTTSTRQRNFSHQQRGARRWRIPPPLRGAGGRHGPEGLVVLQEIKGPLGTLLWSTLRSVNAWVETPPAERDALFPEGMEDWRTIDILTASPREELESALHDLTHFLKPGSHTGPEIVGQAAVRVARWADYNGFHSTASAFFDAAASACLGNPRYALVAGRMARDQADYPRAEAWLQRAIGIGRQAEDWTAYTRAHLSYGKLMLMRGKVPSAQKHYQRALRRANRIANRELQGMALHDLMIIESELERWDNAESFAARAIAAYPVGHDSIRRLAFDVSYIWVKQERFAEAQKVLTPLAPTVRQDEKPIVLGALARSAAGCGDQEVYRVARKDLLKLPHSAAGLAAAWLDVAHGALSLGFGGEAISASRTAQQMAKSRSEFKILFLAERLYEEAGAAITVGAKCQRAPAVSDPAIDTWEVADQIVGKLAVV